MTKLSNLGWRDGTRAFAEGKTVADYWFGRWFDPDCPVDRDTEQCIDLWSDSIAYTRFTDGSEMLLVTTHSGPYSEVTPDIDFEVSLLVRGSHDA